MSSRHAIEKLCFDVSFSTEVDALAQQESLSGLVKGALLDEINSVFSEFSTKDQAVIRIDQLQVDLGVVPLHSYQCEIRNRLSACLKEQLKERLYRVEHERRLNSHDEVIVIGHDARDAEALFHYLKFGYLPWSYQSRSVVEIRQLFATVVSSTLNELARKLILISNQKSAVERLMGIIPPQGIIKLRQWLLSRQSKEFNGLIELLNGNKGSAGHGTLVSLLSALEQSNSDMLQRTWRSLLLEAPADIQAILINLSLDSGCRDGFISHSNAAMRYEWLAMAGFQFSNQLEKTQMVFMGAAKKCGMSYQQADRYFWNHILQRLGSGSGSSFESTQYLLPLLNGIGYWNGERRCNDPVIQALEQARRVEDVGGISAERLSNIFESVDSNGLKEVAFQWDFILEAHSLLLINLLNVHGSKQMIRRGLSRELTPSQLGRLIDLISAGSANFIRKSITIFHRGQFASKAFTEGQSVERHDSVLSGSHVLWEFTLSFFFVERGSHFNKKEYCRSMLREMAAHHNSSYYELIVAMRQWLATLPNQGSHVSELHAIIHELIEASGVKIEPEQSHSLRPYADCLINAFKINFPHGCSKRYQDEFSRFYRRYLFDGQQLAPNIFIKLLGSRLVEYSEKAALFQYAKIIAELQRGNSLDHYTKQVVVEVLQELFDERLNQTQLDIEGGHKLAIKPKSFSRDDKAAIYIENAWQSLLAPYLPMLFERLGFTVNGAFSGSIARERAVRLLQYSVNGSDTAPEYMMVLNKLICGIELERPVTRDIFLTDNEKALTDSLLLSMIEKWSKIGNTSIEALRESFLQREAVLTRKGDSWHLMIEPRSYDVLLDHLPWSYSTIKHGWMNSVIHVEWR